MATALGIHIPTPPDATTMPTPAPHATTDTTAHNLAAALAGYASPIVTTPPTVSPPPTMPYTAEAAVANSAIIQAYRTASTTAEHTSDDA
eukprot:9747139-Alexandrium_andersonii.AAC.1